MRFGRWQPLFVAVGILWAAPVLGSRPVGAADADRDARVAAVLARHCLECHHGQAGKGGLDLSRRHRALAGGDSGAAFVPGKPADSLLIRRIEAGEMPPRGRPRLTDDERQLLRGWIGDDAPWASDPIDPFRYSTPRRAGYDWWSLQPLRHVDVPPTRAADASPHPVDRFIQRSLDEHQLSPAPPADRRTLIRRLSFGLLGLPPAPAAVEAFAASTDPRAYERLVDQMLDSPHYGERWARHWLDVVRFGESQGFERNKFRNSAWKYRDFVVDAFNSDLPYDEFVRWQIAGNVLHPDNPLAVIASGFLTMGPYDLTAYTTGTADMQAAAREEELEGLVATVGQTFLGLTINCGRCHDHKFDPISQREYYQFSAALGGTFQGDERECLTEQARPAVAERMAELRRKLDALRTADSEPAQLSESERAVRRSQLEAILRLLEGGPVHTSVPKQPGPWAVLARGDFRHKGEIVGPRGLSALAGVDADWHLAGNASEADRRKALAHWIADPHNPLTARVIVNRIWLHHFGQGLVPTPSDFGFQGGPPSHPELLDWLAGQLVCPEQGPAWSLKRVQRLILTSETYRRSSQFEQRAATVDADNRLLWRHTAQRLEAETYRDAVLSVSGELDPRMGGPGFREFKQSTANNNETYSVFTGLGGEFNRRALYRTWVRAGTNPLLDLLDCPDPSVAAPKRSVTSTPLQALALLNNEFVEYYALKFAERLRRDAPESVAAQIRLAYALAFGRIAADDEVEWARDFVERQGLPQLCIVLLNANEFVYVD